MAEEDAVTKIPTTDDITSGLSQVKRTTDGMDGQCQSLTYQKKN